METLNNRIYASLLEIANIVFCRNLGAINEKLKHYHYAKLANKGRLTSNELSTIDIRDTEFITIEIESFKCEFEACNIFRLLYNFCKANDIKGKDYFLLTEVIKENENIVSVFTLEASKAMIEASKAKQIDSNYQYYFIDLESSNLYTTSGGVGTLHENKLTDIEGERFKLLLHYTTFKFEPKIYTIRVVQKTDFCGDTFHYAYISEGEGQKKVDIEVCTEFEYPFEKVFERPSDPNEFSIINYKEIVKFIKNNYNPKRYSQLANISICGSQLTISYIDEYWEINNRKSFGINNPNEIELSATITLKDLFNSLLFLKGTLFLKTGGKINQIHCINENSQTSIAIQEVIGISLPEPTVTEKVEPNVSVNTQIAKQLVEQYNDLETEPKKNDQKQLVSKRFRRPLSVRGEFARSKHRKSLVASESVSKNGSRLLIKSRRLVNNTSILLQINSPP